MALSLPAANKLASNLIHDFKKSDAGAGHAIILEHKVASINKVLGP